jgi:hypothetical protein
MCVVQILVAVTMNSAALRDLIPCTLTEMYRSFGKPVCLDHQSKEVTVGRAVITEHPAYTLCDLLFVILNLSKSISFKTS